MSDTKNKTLVVLLGPTGVGKTEMSLRLAATFACPILSADSRQFYRELKIGTAAPTPAELKQASHYFIGSHSIFDTYNAGEYEADVLLLLEKLFQKTDVVMLVGGSMMYIDAVCNGIDDIPTVDETTRNGWKTIYEENGLEFIQNELKRLDPVHFEEVDRQNYKRVLHALEICSMTGKLYSELRTGIKKDRPFDILKIGLNRPRPELYERINTRVLKMLEDGLLDEAKLFFEHRQLNALNTVGYKELFEYFAGNWSFDFAVNRIQQNSRRYAKRQLTWFNSDKEIQWFHPDEEDKIIAFAKNELGRGGLVISD